MWKTAGKGAGRYPAVPQNSLTAIARKSGAKAPHSISILLAVGPRLLRPVPIWDGRGIPPLFFKECASGCEFEAYGSRVFKSVEGVEMRALAGGLVRSSSGISYLTGGSGLDAVIYVGILP